MRQTQRWIYARYPAISSICLLVTLLLSACYPAADVLGKYPAPPPTQALATLFARGIATAHPEYPEPVPGPLGGINSTIPPPTAPATDSILPEAVQAAQYYLSGYLGITQQGIGLISWENAVWYTSGLGCQPAGSLATPSPVSGYRATFGLRGEVYEVRSDTTGELICVAKALQPGERVPMPNIKSTQTPAELARSHLATRLGISMDEILIEEVQAGEWEDETLGCPQPVDDQGSGTHHESILGERILLAMGETDHEYHTGGPWLVYCGVIQQQ